MADPTGSVSAVFSYFNPTKSPYYTIGLAAGVGLFYACEVPAVVRNDGLFVWIAVPATIVACLSLALAIDSRNVLTRDQHADQLRFSRSACISVAVLALCLGGKAIGISMEPPSPDSPRGILCQVSEYTQWIDFKLNTVLCSIQIGLFLLINWALNKDVLPSALSDRNYVQITLLTSAFLAETSVNLSYATDATNQGCVHHQRIAYVMAVLWAVCMLFWIAKLAKMGIIKVQRPQPPSP